jgi:hypothetical protein
MQKNNFLFSVFLLCALILCFGCSAANNSYIESNFIALLSAVRENDRDTILTYAPFLNDVTKSEEDAVIDLFTQIAAEQKTIKAVPGGTKIKNLSVTLHDTGVVFTFSFEKQKGTWVLKKNIRVTQLVKDAPDQ